MIDIIASVAPERPPPDSFLGEARGPENRLEIELDRGEIIQLRAQGAGRPACLCSATFTKLPVSLTKRARSASRHRSPHTSNFGSPESSSLAILRSHMDLGIASVIAITGPAFTESRGFIALTVNAMRSPFHVFPRFFPPTSTSSRRRR
jgi:hypothetical protein